MPFTPGDLHSRVPRPPLQCSFGPLSGLQFYPNGGRRSTPGGIGGRDATAIPKIGRIVCGGRG